jgi:tetratricopeptide (TPR) repeat protein
VGAHRARSIALCVFLACGPGERAPDSPPTDPRGADRWVELGDEAQARYRVAREPELLASAETAYRLALDHDARSADALVGLAGVRGVEHAFGESLALAERALALDPGHVRAHGILADAALELGRGELAAEHVQAMLDLRPDLASYGRAALVLERGGDPMRAALVMRRAISAGAPRAESTAWCRAQLARMLWEQGALLPAQQVVEEALSLAPEHPDVLAMAGTLAAARGDREDAIGLYERAVARGVSPQALAALGDLHALAGRSALAEQAWARAEQDLGVEGRGEGNLALARFLAQHRRHLDVALREAEAAYRRLGTAAAADVLAWTYHRFGRDEEAHDLIGEALAGPLTSEVLFHAGMIEAARGRRQRARQLLYEALNLNPSFNLLAAREAEETWLALAPESSASTTR